MEVLVSLGMVRVIVVNISRVIGCSSISRVSRCICGVFSLWLNSFGVCLVINLVRNMFSSRYMMNCCRL